MRPRTVAILCAASGGVYCGMEGVDVYTPERDARTFPGGVPIVAHPPCRGWSAFLRNQAKPVEGELELGLWCAAQLREWGGVLEHPAHSRLWDAAGIPKPGDRSAGPVWSMEVWQNWWGYPVRKTTWLAFAGIGRDDLPDVPFSLRNTRGDAERFQRLCQRKRSATSPKFAEWLVEVARRVQL